MRVTAPQIARFRKLVRDFYRRGGRRFPWRPPLLKLRRDGEAHDPYAVVVSEVMLQQTQVGRVAVFYPRFIARFPTFGVLAAAPTRAVLRQWQGLGYNRRALALKRLAEAVVRDHGGALPRDPAVLERLPGLGPATAGAIAAFAFDRAAPFTETNVRRVFIHHFFPRRKRVREEEILALVARTLPRTAAREWYYALMDYGSYLARAVPNPNRRHARYRRQPKFKGSSRELRGKVLRLMLAGTRTPAVLARRLKVPRTKMVKVLSALRREGFR